MGCLVVDEQRWDKFTMFVRTLFWFTNDQWFQTCVAAPPIVLQTTSDKWYDLFERRMTVAGFFVVFLIIVVDLVSGSDNFSDEHSKLRGWVCDHEVTGTIIATLIVAGVTILYLPFSFVGIGIGFTAGSVWGMVNGWPYAAGICMLGLFFGSMFSYVACCLPGWCGRNQSWRSDFLALTRKMSFGQVLHFNLMMRLHPLIPVASLNYLMATTGSSNTAYILGLFGMFPGVMVITFFSAAAGATLNSAKNEFNVDTDLAVFLAGAFVTLVTAWILADYCTRETEALLRLGIYGSRPHSYNRDPAELRGETGQLILAGAMDVEQPARQANIQKGVPTRTGTMMEFDDSSATRLSSTSQQRPKTQAALQPSPLVPPAMAEETQEEVQPVASEDIGDNRKSDVFEAERDLQPPQEDERLPTPSDRAEDNQML